MHLSSLISSACFLYHCCINNVAQQIFYQYWFEWSIQLTLKLGAVTKDDSKSKKKRKEIGNFSKWMMRFTPAAVLHCVVGKSYSAVCWKIETNQQALSYRTGLSTKHLIYSSSMAEAISVTCIRKKQHPPPLFHFSYWAEKVRLFYEKTPFRFIFVLKRSFSKIFYHIFRMSFIFSVLFFCVSQLRRSSVTCLAWTSWSSPEPSCPRGSKWAETTSRKHRPKSRSESREQTSPPWPTAKISLSFRDSPWNDTSC